MRTFSYFSAGLSALFVTFGVAPGAAQACTGCPSPPFFNGLSGVEDGGSLVANAPFVIRGGGISVANVSVTVDGEEASMVLVPEFSSENDCGTANAYRILPEPAEGALVEISGDVCDPEINETCDDLDLSFTIEAADHEAPSAPKGVSMDIYRAYSEWACADIAQTVWYFDIEADYDEPQEALALWKIEILGDPEGEPSETFYRSRSDEARYGNGAVLSDPNLSPCFRVSGVDRAGNTSEESVTLCDACHYRADPPDDDTPWYEIPPEPEWLDEERVYGGSCDDGTIPEPEPDLEETGESQDPEGSESGSAGGDDGIEGGCACALDGGRPRSLGLFGLGVLGLFGLRRRRRRGAK